MVRLDEAQARKVGDGPPLIVDSDRFGIVHSEYDLARGVDVHVIDRRTKCIIARLDGQKEACSDSLNCSAS